MIINITTFDLLLRKHGITQAALAQRARLGTKTIGRIRRGEELRLSNAEKIAAVFGVSIDVLQLPPSEQLQKEAGKKSGLSRLVADLSGQALNALTLTSLRYKIPEKTILEAGPYMFTILAELSLKRRRDKLEAWKDAALAALGSGPRRGLPGVDFISNEVWELYYEELESIEKRDLSGGFEGEREYIEDTSVSGDNHASTPERDHAFMVFIEDITKEGGFSDPSFQEWVWTSSEHMMPDHFVPHYDTISEFFDPENVDRLLYADFEIAMQVFQGDILLKDMPDDLFHNGTGPARRGWALSHPNNSRREEFLRLSSSAAPSDQTDDALNGGPDV
jgi:transcriptional regulator with XRE-family HTH domain